MKVRHIVASVLALTIAAISSTSFADGGTRTYITYPISNVDMGMGHHGGHHAPTTTASTSIAVVDSYGIGMRPAMRVNHHGRGYYDNRFEQRWGKDWRKKHNYKVIVVKPGDSLSKIAARRGTTVERLMRLNNMNAYEANHIEIGQMLRVA